jgi:hypothetical protein
MGHGAWMGITWENMEDGWMGLKHNSQNFTCFSRICFKAWTTQALKRALGSSSKLDMFWWVVGFEVQVLWHAILTNQNEH